MVFEKLGVRLAYLFGSQQEKGKQYLEEASEIPPDPSDLDIGLLLKDSPATTYERFGALYFELSKIFAPFKVDIIFLHEVHSLLKFEIIKGFRVYAENEQVADDFEDMVMKFASDLAVKRRIFEPDFMEAIEHGHFEIEYP